MTSWSELARDYQHALGEDGEPDLEPTFADRGVTRRHVARKPGPCEHCPIDRGVRPGEAYLVFVGLSEDRRDFFYMRSCEAMPDACRAALPANEIPSHAAAACSPDEVSF